MKLMEDVKKAIDEKDYSLAINTIDNAEATLDPVYKVALLPNLKFTTLLEFDPAEALRFANEVAKEKPQSKFMFAQVIGEKEGLPKELYFFAIESFKDMLASPGAVKPLVYNIIAKTYFQLGDALNAVDYQQQAVDSAKESLEKGEYQGTVNNNTLKEYQTTLEKYKSKK